MENKDFCLSEFNYSIPASLIAQQPVLPRDSSRLLIIDRKKGEIKEGIFRDISKFFQKGDVIVLNDTKVINARLLGRKENGGKVEVLLINEIEEGRWNVLVRPAKRCRVGDDIIFNEGKVTSLEKDADFNPVREGSPLTRFTPLEKATPIISEWLSPYKADGGFSPEANPPLAEKPPSAYTVSPVRDKSLNGVRERSSLTGFTAKIIDKTPQGGRVLQFFPKEIRANLDSVGKVPLPHYIKKEIDDSQKYQTVYAQKEGAIAAPTAGLHFTENLLLELKRKGVNIVYITLHCGLATFRPVKAVDIRNHTMEPEGVKIPSLTAEIINKAKKGAKRIVAVGTTSIRTLESAACLGKRSSYYIKSFCGHTNLYVVPGYKFKIVDTVLTNFHTPCSTNLILISAFCGKDLLKKSYDYAVKNNFRFFSFGDAMMII